MKQYAVGLDIGGTDLKLGIVSGSGTIVRNIERPTGSGRKTILGNIKNAVDELVKGSGVGWDRIHGIGCGTPGLADAKGNVVTGAMNIKGWNGTPLGPFLRRTFKTNVTVDNDVTALASGEAMFGSARGMTNVLFLAFGTGLGGGIIMNGQVYRGKSGYAAEIGHMKVAVGPAAGACTCGGRGCLEAYASRVGLERMIREHAGKFKATKITPSSTVKQVYDLAEYGKDRFGLFLVKEIGDHLGVGLASLVHLFDPEAIVLGGGFVKSGKFFTDSFMPAYLKEVMPWYRTHKVRFLTSKFGKEGGIVGTASLVLRDRPGV
jgi:glucokinase